MIRFLNNAWKPPWPYGKIPKRRPSVKIKSAVELLTTGERQYADFLVKNTDLIVGNIQRSGWIVGPAIAQVANAQFTRRVTDAVKLNKLKVDSLEKRNPYGIPYEPYIWGSGWGIQNFGVEQYFLHRYYPEIFSENYMLHAMNFILGCHPGSNTASFASGVGSKSLTVAYGFNRDEWSYIPGGICSGTALISPDYPDY